MTEEIKRTARDSGPIEQPKKVVTISEPHKEEHLVQQRPKERQVESIAHPSKPLPKPASIEGLQPTAIIPHQAIGLDLYQGTIKPVEQPKDRHGYVPLKSPASKVVYKKQIGDYGADPTEYNDKIPDRYIHASNGQIPKARERWQNAKIWRNSNRVDSILERTPESFELVSRHLPHFILRRSKQGQYVFIEQPGHPRLKELWENGLNEDDIIMHYVFIMEYMWRKLNLNDLGMIIVIIDLKVSKYYYYY